MFEGMARKDGVVLLEVELHVLLKPVGFEQAVDRGRVVVILVLGGLLRLGLDENGALETDLVLVLDNEREEASRLFQFLPDIGVDQRFIALALAPHHVVFTAQPLR